MVLVVAFIPEGSDIRIGKSTATPQLPACCCALAPQPTLPKLPPITSCSLSPNATLWLLAHAPILPDLGI